MTIIRITSGGGGGGISPAQEAQLNQATSDIAALETEQTTQDGNISANTTDIVNKMDKPNGSTPGFVVTVDATGNDVEYTALPSGGFTSLNILSVRLNDNGTNAATLGGTSTDTYSTATPIDLNLFGSLKNTGGMLDGANGQLVIPADGTYTLEGELYCNDNGGANSRFDFYIGDTTSTVYTTEFSLVSQYQRPTTFTYTADFVAGDRLDLRVGTTTGTETVSLRAGSVTLKQLSSSTVISPTDTAVNDQAASGYIDIGNTRIQWGTALSVSDTPQLINFPQPFASVPSITLSIDQGTSADTGQYSFINPSTTGFEANRADNDWSNAQNAVWNWQAIGVKS